MSNPFVYSPQTSYNSYPRSVYTDPFYADPQHSPFVPSLSPYGSFSPLPPVSPHLAPNSLAFPGSSGGLSVETPTDYGEFNRQRRPSWHGAPGSPYNQNYFDYSRERRHSYGQQAAPFGGYTPASPYSPGLLSPTGWWNNYPLPMSPSTPMLHPILDGISSQVGLRFDLSSPQFRPARISPTGWVDITFQELQERATNPPAAQLRVICDLIPQWPLNLHCDPSAYLAQDRRPIMVSDVLVSLHGMLHQRIGHHDWAKLTRSEEQAVARAYGQRCAAFGVNAQQERNQGVKKVDYLVGKVWFRGLVPTGEQDTFRLLLG
ncbi:hypothetical protein C8J56DRAFT_792558 [Mycena floridula]|nr:hypothetical protein C8J56DRAFT_792558 [Mycena floridula]